MIIDNKHGKFDFWHGMAAFLIGAAVFLAAFIPYIAGNGWLMYFYGDFDAQQVPFTLYIRQCLDNFSIPQYDFLAGTGQDFLDAYTFYNLFSPFTLITLLIPQKVLIYAIPFIIALKFGVCGLTSYLYASRFCGNRDYAVIASVLYTFSGFLMVNFLFHYMDALALFPLMLYSLEKAVIEKKRGVFGFTVALCALTNYYIFIISVIFTVIYFLVRLFDEKFRIGVKDFFCLAAESITGVMIAGIVLVPAAAAVIGNPRFGGGYSASDIIQMLVYDTPWRYARIIQSAFMMPDLQGYTNIFPDFIGFYPAGSRWSSQALYLPMFGMSGVIAFSLTEKKNWKTKLTILCVIIALVPVFNSIFTMGRVTYYARWMFAPTLIMSVMTACALEKSSKGFKAGIIINSAVLLVMAVFSVFFPMEKLSLWKDGAYFSDLQKWVNVGITALGLILTAIIVFAVKRDEMFSKKAIVIIVMMAFVSAESTSLFGMGENRQPYSTVYAMQNPPEIEEVSYGRRITVDAIFDNMNLLWGESSLYFFNSSVDPYVNNYCESIGIRYGDIYNDYISECLCSVKEVIVTDVQGINFSDKHIQKEHDEVYYIKENPDFIPMGFCYDYFISREKFDSLDTEVKHGMYLKAIVLDDIMALETYVEEIPESEIYPLDDTELSAECAKRREKCADIFTYDENGFGAEIYLDSPELVFFSVAYSDDFTAYVDGEKVDIYNANLGFMAVPVPEGRHSIRFEYHSKMRDVGAVLSVVGLVAMAVYIAIILIRRRKTEV